MLKSSFFNLSISLQIMGVILLLTIHTNANARVSSSAETNLNKETVLDLNLEAKLPNVQKRPSDFVEIGYAYRNMGRPRLVVPLQTTSYDFTKVFAPVIGYQRHISSELKLSWVNRMSYFDQELQKEGLITTRLHVIPIQSELLWNMKEFRLLHTDISPFLGIGLIGAIQIQRGAQVESSEFAELRAARVGLDWRILKSDNLIWIVSPSVTRQQSFSKSEDEWSGTGYDLSLRLGL